MIESEDQRRRPNRVVAFVPDLMDRSRLGRLGAIPVVHVSGPAALAAEARDGDLVVVDLSRPGVIEGLGQVAGEIVAFASHVDTELLERARAAGCAEVLPRSRFFATLAGRVGGVSE